jgi:hypothetical protein
MVSSFMLPVVFTSVVFLDEISFVLQFELIFKYLLILQPSVDRAIPVAPATEPQAVPTPVYVSHPVSGLKISNSYFV